MNFSSHQMSTAQARERVLNLIEILPLSFLLKLNALCNKNAFRTSVNRSCDYEIVFHDSQQSYQKWEHFIANDFYSLFCFCIVASEINIFFMYM